MTAHNPKRTDSSRASLSPAESKPRRAVSPGPASRGLAALIIVLAGVAYIGWQSGNHRAQTPPVVLMPPPVIASPALPPPSPSSSGRAASSPAVQSPDTGRADPFAPLVASSAGKLGAPMRPPLWPPPAAASLPPVSPGQGPGSPGSGNAPPGAGLVVAGIVGGTFKVAIVEREAKTYIVRVGERIGAATVVGISGDGVVLRQDGNVFTLVLARASGVTSLVATGATPAPGSSGTSRPQTPPAGTGQPPQPAPGATTGTPAAPAPAQPAGGPAPGGSTPAPSGTTPTPSGSTTGTPAAGQGAPANQSSSPAPAFPSVVPSNTAQPPTPPVMPTGSTVFTPQPKGGAGAPPAP